jgi:hypothetical protein
MSTRTPPPYWLSGTETCELCEQPHLLQAEYRCVACDCPACEHCVVVDRRTGEVLCHTCHGAAVEEAN